MPGHDDTGSPVDLGGSEDTAQPGLSRRSVLWGAASAGAVGIAATAFVGGTALPALAATPAARGAKAEPAELPEGEHLVVHVRNAKSGEIDVFRGTSQTRLHDKELAARLIRASR